jgi:hypothetical protein
MPVGQTLCHDMTAILEDGFKGVKFKRGHVITASDMPELKDIGKDHIFVWEPGGRRGARGGRSHRPVRGYVRGEGIQKLRSVRGQDNHNRIAADGLLCIEFAGAEGRINSVPDYTVACHSQLPPVTAGTEAGRSQDRAAGDKARKRGEGREHCQGEHPVLSVKPYRKLKAGMVITGSEVYYGRIKDAFEPILTEKLNSYGAEILGCVKCPDDVEMITAAIDGFVKQGAELILLTGGMSVDPDDVTPTANQTYRSQGCCPGRTHAAGNMLNIAYLGGTVLVGVPGHRCTRR